MNAIISPSESFYPGQGFYLDVLSPNGRYKVAFEDNLDAAWFHAIDTALDNESPQSSLWLYQPNDKNPFLQLPDDDDCIVNMIWSADGQRAGLCINSHAIALFDFEHRYGFCETPIPSVTHSRWQQHRWNDRLLSLLGPKP